MRYDELKVLNQQIGGIKLHLTRDDDYVNWYLSLPATSAEIGETWTTLGHIGEDMLVTSFCVFIK